jgi:hypothetical protein
LAKTHCRFITVDTINFKSPLHCVTLTDGFDCLIVKWLEHQLQAFLDNSGISQPGNLTIKQ